MADGLRTAPWTFADYLSEVGAYRAAIAASAPAVQIVGPDSSSGRLALPWVTAAATAERPALLTDHYYPLTKCQREAPELSELLSPATRADETATLKQLAAISRASGLPLRLDETNNISCRGQPGVSNVFASALWAVDYVARAMASGVAGLNVHDLIAEPLTYSPLAAGDAQELARGAQRLVVSLRLRRRCGAGPILRLTARGPGATAGATLGGRSVSSAGTWNASRRLPRVSGRPGSLELDMPPSSAALVTLYPTG